MCDSSEKEQSKSISVWQMALAYSICYALLKKFNEIYWIYTVLIRFFGYKWKRNISKTSFAFFSERGFQSEKLELLHHFSSYTQYFVFVLKVSTRRNFSSTSFFKIDSWAEKIGIYCRQTTLFYAFLCFF